MHTVCRHGDIRQEVDAYGVSPRRQVRCSTCPSKETRLDSGTRFLRLAVRAAHQSTSRMRHGAVVHRGGRLLAVGWNRSRVHDTWVLHQPRHACTIHAEAAALRGIDAAGATVLVIRLHRDGSLADSRPCNGCWDALHAAGIRQVIYS